MMDDSSHALARQAIDALSAAIETGSAVSHEQIANAFQAIVLLRDRMLAGYRSGTTSANCLQRVNSVTSLAFGGEFPLSGFHVHRLEQARAALQEQLAEAATRRRPSGEDPAG